MKVTFRYIRAMTAVKTFTFDSFVFYPEQNRLSQDGVDIRLEPKVNDLLLIFLESNGRTVTKEELFDQLWSGQIVTDDSLKRVISKLRSVLKDTVGSPKYIETITGKGYRFKFEKKKSRKSLFIGLSMSLILLLTLLFYNLTGNAERFKLHTQLLTFTSNEVARPFPSADDSSIVFISNSSLFDFYFTDELNLYSSETKRLVTDSSLKFLSAYLDVEKKTLIEYVIDRSFTGIRLVDRKTEQITNLIDLPPSKLVDIDINYRHADLYYTASTENGTHVFRYSTRTQEIEQLSQTENHHDFRCRISDDNRFLAVLRADREFSDIQLVVIDLIANREMEVPLAIKPIDIDWNPDGYLYMIGEAKTTSNLYRISRDMDLQFVSAIDRQINSIRSFNKSRSFAAVQWYSKQSLQQINLTTGVLSEFDPINRSNYRPSLNPEKQLIAYKTDRNESVDLYLRAL
ncbi:MAG: winged helix-turn-helix domain-containing protein, partial [Calditrichaeota bacterium]|nr:winged helix-turn-helix domain-containing protein [Calditrichota bacterium]